MAEVSSLHRFHLQTTHYDDEEEEEEEDDPDPYAFDFDSLSPPNSTFFIPSDDFNFSPNSEPGSVYSDSDQSDFLANPNSVFFYDDEEQMNFVSDLFVTRDGNVTDDTDTDTNSRVLLDGDFGPEEAGFGSEFDGVLLPLEMNDFSIRDGLRVVGIESESDSDDAEVNSGVIGQIGDSDVHDFWSCLRIDDQRVPNEDFEWEEVNERGEDRDNLSSVIDGIEEISVSSDISSSEGGNSNSSDGGEDQVRNLEWEFLLAVNNVERSLEFDTDGNDDGVSYLAVRDDYAYDTDSDALFGLFLENEGTVKGSPPAAKSVIENLPLVVLKDEDLRENKTACAVCKDEILVAEKVTKLPCSHHYHWDCILPWLNIRNTCPVCRHELLTDDADYERRKNGRRSGAGIINDFQVRYNFELVP